MKKSILRLVLGAFLLLVISLIFIGRDVHAVQSPECRWTKVVSSGALVNPPGGSVAIQAGALPLCASVDTGDLGFKIPSLGDLLTFAIRAFFVIAGLAALFYLLLGALAWITSGGDKDAVTAAREKIQAAVLGMILIVAVLAIIWTLEQVIFNRRICLGLSCPLTLPGLIEKSGNTATTWVPTGAGTGHNVISSSTDEATCCICKRDDGTYGDVVNSRYVKCGANGTGEPL